MQIYQIMKEVESVEIKMGADKSYKNTERRHRYQLSRDMFVNTLMVYGFPTKSKTWNLLSPEIAKTVNGF